MEKIAIVTDSTSDLSPQDVNSLGVKVVELYIVHEDKSYRVNKEIDTDKFYKLQAESKTLPATSQPTPSDFKQVYGELAGEGYQNILSIHISGELSGTLKSAAAAAREMAGVNIAIVDSRLASIGIAMLVKEAHKMIAEGRGLTEVAATLEELREKVHVIFSVGTLEYLRRNGRIGGAKALIGSLLNLKPLLTVVDGRIAPLDKVRSKKKLIDKMVAYYNRHKSKNTQNIYLAHGNCPEKFNEFKNSVLAQLEGVPPVLTRVGPVVGAHAGPDLLAIGFLA